jgi:hypothetical protein
MIVEIRGLESIQRFTGPTFEVDQTALVRAEQANAARAATAAVRKRYTVKRAPRPLEIDGSADDWRDVPSLEIARKGFPERAQARLAWDERFLYMLFDVTDGSPWRNEGRDFARLFKTGDAVDLQLATAPEPKAAEGPGPSDVRLLFAPLEGKPVCVLMKSVDKTAPADKAYNYHSPVGDKRFDRVEVLAEARVAVKVEADRYRVEAAIPLERIGLKPAAGLTVRGDAGFISSDARGTINVARTYWSNEVTNLTNDMPSEAWLYPATWGELKFE